MGFCWPRAVCGMRCLLFFFFFLFFDFVVICLNERHFYETIDYERSSPFAYFGILFPYSSLYWSAFHFVVAVALFNLFFFVDVVVAFGLLCVWVQL